MRGKARFGQHQCFVDGEFSRQIKMIRLGNWRACSVEGGRFAGVMLSASAINIARPVARAKGVAQLARNCRSVAAASFGSEVTPRPGGAAGTAIAELPIARARLRSGRCRDSGAGHAELFHHAADGSIG